MKIWIYPDLASLGITTCASEARDFNSSRKPGGRLMGVSIGFAADGSKWGSAPHPEIFPDQRCAALTGLAKLRAGGDMGHGAG